MPGKKEIKKAKSKSQQRLFGMVTAYKKGDLKLDDLPPSLAKKVKSIADGKKKKTGDKRKKTKGITKKAAKEMASTKHKGLPETVKESRTFRFEKFLNEEIGKLPPYVTIHADNFDESVKLINSILSTEDSVMIQVRDEGVETFEKILGGLGLEEIEERTFSSKKPWFYTTVSLKTEDGDIEETDYMKRRRGDTSYEEEFEETGMTDYMKRRISEAKEDEELKSTGNMVVKSMGDFADDVANLDVEALEGGEAEGMTIEDVAKKHNIPVEYLEKIMPDAIEIEMEHTDDPEVAARISLDHLAETPLYYDEILGLPNMENELEEIEDEEIEEIVDGRLEKKVKKFNEDEEELEQEHKKQKEDVKESVNAEDIKDQIRKLEDVIRYAKTRADAEELQDEIEELEELLEEEGESIQESIIKFSDYDIVEEGLNEFVDSVGDTEIWYEKGTNFDSWDFRKEMYEKEKDHNNEYTEKYGPLPDANDLEKTHALLGTIGETDLNAIYDMMNNWGVGDESNKFLSDKGVGHTSMSIGDIIKIGNDVFFVDDRGFKNITE